MRCLCSGWRKLQDALSMSETGSQERRDMCWLAQCSALVLIRRQKGQDQNRLGARLLCTAGPGVQC